MSNIVDLSIGNTAWFITRNSTDDGWFAVQRKITRILGQNEPIYYGGINVSAPVDQICGSAAEAFIWISRH